MKTMPEKSAIFLAKIGQKIDDNIDPKKKTFLLHFFPDQSYFPMKSLQVVEEKNFSF
jgi:hypothetical protein